MNMLRKWYVRSEDLNLDIPAGTEVKLMFSARLLLNAIGNIICY